MSPEDIAAEDPADEVADKQGCGWSVILELTGVRCPSRDHPAGMQPGKADTPLTTQPLTDWPNPTGISTSGCHRCAAPVRRPGQRAQLPHPLVQNGHPPFPADPVGDHRGRHRRELCQQLTDPRLDRVDHRTGTSMLMLRWRLRAQRRTHRVPSDPQPPGDRPDAQPLGPIEPADLRPILHVNHPPSSPALNAQGNEIQHDKWWTRQTGGQFSSVDKGSVFTRWRQPGPPGSLIPGEGDQVRP